jgi:flagellar hook-associated protein 2
MAISAAGVGSGLDVNSIVTGLMSIERRPLEAVNTQKSTFQSKISAYGTLKSALSSFQTSVGALSSASKFNAQAVKVSNTGIFTATSDGSATIGNYDVTVSQLARSQKIASSGFASVNDTVGTGTLTISFGTYTPNAVPPETPTPADNTFVANADKTDITLTIDSSNNTLAGIRDAINAANESVSATIVNDGTANRLVITSKDSGAVNSLKIAVTDDDGNNTNASGLSQFAFDPTATAGAGKNMLQMQAAKNAVLNIDGIDIVKPSNNISDAISGVTLNLLKISDGETVSLGVESDVETIKKSVNGFVDAYNKLNTSLRSLTFIDTNNSSNNGRLVGDSAIRNMAFKIRSMMTSTVATGTSINSLTQIGVSFQRDGTLALDSTKLENAISTNFDDIKTLFAGGVTATDPAISFASSTSATVEGTYAINISQIGSSLVNYAGTINGQGGSGTATTLSGAFGTDTQGLVLNIAGGALGDRGTVTYTQGYASRLSSYIDELLSDEGTYQSKIDGFNSSIKSLDTQAERLNVRLTTIEARYRAQFTQLDTLISSMQTTSSYLTQQLSAIANNN